MPTVWFSFRRSMNCGSDPSDVHSPRNTKQLSSILTKKTPATRSGCSRSISNLRDVMTTMHGSKRHISIVNENPSANYSPRSIGSSEFHNPSSHDIMLSDSKFDQLKTETVNVMKSGRVLAERESLGHGDKKRASRVDEVSDEGFGDGNVCHRCRERFTKSEDLESHHLQMHAVSELVEGDSSRKIVEIICRSSNQPHNSNRVKIDKILKIHNTRRTLARFEDHRETVKTKANKLPKKHPRCIADGNELLRFHGTSLACSLGVNESFNLCVSDKCGVCRIIRRGFSGKNEIHSEIGVFTASTSERALESLLHNDDETLMMTRKALLVCRVIAGRVHRPIMENNARSVSEFMGFDSLAGKIGVCSNIEELYLFDSAALLPCFLIICKN